MKIRMGKLRDIEAYINPFATPKACSSVDTHIRSSSETLKYANSRHYIE